MNIIIGQNKMVIEISIFFYIVKFICSKCQ